MPTPWTTSRKRNAWPRWTEVSFKSLRRPGERKDDSEKTSRRQRHGPGVVAIDPTGIGLSAEPGIRPRSLLDPRRPLLACRLEAAKRIRNSIPLDTIEAARQYRRVLDRHRRTLRHVGRHRVAGVAEQRYVALTPAVQRVTIDNRPFVHVRTGGQHLLDLAVEACKRLAQFPDVALRGPGLDPELRLGLAGDKVDLAAVRLDVIDDDVAVLAPPFGAIVDPFAVEQRGRIGRAVGDAPGETDRGDAEQDVSHDGMNAIRPDHGIGGHACTIGECQADTFTGLIQPDKPVVEPDAFIRNGAGERRMKIAAMREQIGRAKLLFGALAKNHIEFDFTGAPIAVVPGARVERLRAQPRFQSQPAQHLHGITADLDAGPDPRELRGLFVDGDVD